MGYPSVYYLFNIATRQIEAENSLINSFAKIRKITEKNELFKYYLHGKYKLFSRL